MWRFYALSATMVIQSQTVQCRVRQEEYNKKDKELNIWGFRPTIHKLSDYDASKWILTSGFDMNVIMWIWIIAVQQLLPWHTTNIFTDIAGFGHLHLSRYIPTYKLRALASHLMGVLLAFDRLIDGCTRRAFYLSAIAFDKPVKVYKISAVSFSGQKFSLILIFDTILKDVQWNQILYLLNYFRCWNILGIPNPIGTPIRSPGKSLKIVHQRLPWSMKMPNRWNKNNWVLWTTISVIHLYFETGIESSWNRVSIFANEQ